MQLSTLEFTDAAQNAVLIGGPGTSKTHLATAIGVSDIAAKGKRVSPLARGEPLTPHFVDADTDLTIAANFD
ncbi:ATP-binding protein [Rhodoferax sp.]|uniref:ATP-binding protein n=1 Tax=Rhodoferax sp. TaxID=50421 RepID=UPI003BB4C45B